MLATPHFIRRQWMALTLASALCMAGCSNDSEKPSAATPALAPQAGVVVPSGSIPAAPSPVRPAAVITGAAPAPVMDVSSDPLYAGPATVAVSPAPAAEEIIFGK